MPNHLSRLLPGSAAALLALLLLCPAPGARAQDRSIDQPSDTDLYDWFNPVIDVQHIIARRYVTRPDLDEMQKAAIDGMTEALGDEYTQYIPAEATRDFDKNLRGEYVGIGAAVRMEDGWVTIVTPLDESPAYRAGVMAGDRIIEVDGESTMGMSLDAVINLLTGKPGTEVVVTVERGADRLEIPIIREEIVTRTVSGVQRDADDSWDFLLDPEFRIGYIRVSQFTAGTMPEFEAAMGRLLEQDAQGVIIDLRFNPGGLLSAAIQMSDMFLSSGLIVSTRGRAHDEESVYAVEDDTLPDIPLVLLLNRRSASGSEVVGGALRDNGRAIVIGERSFGKGSVQSVLPLPSGAGRLKITEQHYYGPSGDPLHRTNDSTAWGVDPSPGFYVPMTDREYNEMLRIRRESEIIRGDNGEEDTRREAPDEPQAEEEGGAANAAFGEPEWIRDHLKDKQLAAAARAIRDRLEEGEWIPLSEDAGSEAVEVAELRRMQLVRERLMRELTRVDERIQAVRGVVPEDQADRPRLVPRDARITGGRLEIYDAEGALIATLDVTGDDLEPWLVDAPVEVRERSGADSPDDATQ